MLECTDTEALSGAVMLRYEVSPHPPTAGLQSFSSVCNGVFLTVVVNRHGGTSYKRHWQVYRLEMHTWIVQIPRGQVHHSTNCRDHAIFEIYMSYAMQFPIASMMKKLNLAGKCECWPAEQLRRLPIPFTQSIALYEAWGEVVCILPPRV